jgi:hypothetical protein
LRRKLVKFVDKAVERLCTHLATDVNPIPVRTTRRASPHLDLVSSALMRVYWTDSREWCSADGEEDLCRIAVEAGNSGPL